jgi:sugar phosphate isomerase/epimerase
VKRLENFMALTRRKLLAGFGFAGVGAMLPAFGTESQSCPFRLAVINDEITQDFEKACKTVAQEFGLSWIELRSMWNTNVIDLSPKQIQDCQRLLAEYKLRVTDIGSPLFKTDWPGAPISKQSERRDQFHAKDDASEQDRVLGRSIAAAKAFKTDRVRCFDYWRLDDQKPYREAINAKLRQAAERCERDGLILLLENEMSCNTATGEEAAAVLKAIPNKNFMLNWDPGNAAAIGSTPYPDGYRLLPKHRIGHCHCKDVFRDPDGKYGWAPVGAGIVDWIGQFRALQRDGYRYGLSLETHWRGGFTPEEATRRSFDGLKKTLAKAGMSC